MRPILVISLMLLLAACRKDPEAIVNQPPVVDYVPSLPQTPYDYESALYPDHFLNDPSLDYLFVDIGKNPVTNEGATLGRVLFYDRQLSANNTTSCGSCHHQDKAFTDGLQYSPGFEGALTGRNSMAIINADLNEALFWDHRADTPEEQALMPIQSAVEMGMTLEALVIKLQGIDYYKPLFEAAFGDTVITANRISVALGQFIKSIRSYRSKYDEGVPLNFANFTAEEVMGRELFFTPSSTCFQCHFSENFGGLFIADVGLDSIYIDGGVGTITANPAEFGKFKAVSLRNIELTGPYMHDGRFQTLEEVMDFYSEDIQQHYNLDFRLSSEYTTGGAPLQINFTDEEKSALIAFMKTLTDWELVNDPKYSDPFPH